MRDQTFPIFYQHHIAQIQTKPNWLRIEFVIPQWWLSKRDLEVAQGRKFVAHSENQNHC